MTARLVTAVLALAVAGCATSTVPISLEASKPVPADRIYQRELTVPEAGRTAKLTFLRDAGALGSACTHLILVDEKLAFGIRSGERQTLYVAPGRHTLELQIAGGLCAGMLSMPVETVLGDGAEETYRILISSLRSRPRLMKVGATPPFLRHTFSSDEPASNAASQPAIARAAVMSAGACGNAGRGWITRSHHPTSRQSPSL